jgi:hypothetical protein
MLEEQEPTKKRFQDSFRRMDGMDPFLFGRPTPAIAVLLLKLYHENIIRLSTTDNRIKCMIGILETNDGELYCTFSGDPFELANFDDRHKMVVSMLENANVDVAFPEYPRGTLEAPTSLFEPYKDATQYMFSPDDKELKTIRPSVHYVHSLAYLESRRDGYSFAPFKVIEDGMLECGYGSSCVEAKLFSYIYSLGKTFDDIKGFAAYWIGNQRPPNHTNANFCYRPENSEKIEHLATVFLELLDKDLSKHLKETYPEQILNIIKSVVGAIALPCVGCVANYDAYKQNKYSRWNPTKCRRSVTMIGGRSRYRRKQRKTRKRA